MRKIEQRMVQAINTNKSVNLRNTAVSQCIAGSRIMLHGHWIGQVSKSTDGLKTTVKLCSAGWETPTTKSRLNAILTGIDFPFGIRQEKDEWYVIDFRESAKVPNSRGNLVHKKHHWKTPQNWVTITIKKRVATARAIEENINVSEYSIRFSESYYEES